MQESGEMYLETILILKQRMETVRSIDIADYMKFSKPSVSRAVALLKSDGFITVDSDGHIELSEKGQRVAAKIYERHEVLTHMLLSLGVDSENASRDACKMEHDISDATFEAIKRNFQK